MRYADQRKALFQAILNEIKTNTAVPREKIEYEIMINFGYSQAKAKEYIDILLGAGKITEEEGVLKIASS